ncbi:orotate phosphoribosyltransferase [Zooshikella marina]|uniref:orotate phosphoribosyltransferase n=1 Tax=Zooshikella ganghwensis TaxID=202772 RepID=UPI001BAF880C|nr:orotate phosphoribosyltransferase [Zooshikella ganghwensis]MBU2706347.1 orotate phosphoribosyltransferase [Zooshikella ganghwensis]
MQNYQRDFIKFAIEHKVLTFGEFTLKSGRKSPYFFNAGLFKTGEAMLHLGRFYAAALMDAQLNYDVLFGPAYKGIPLVTSVAISLACQGHGEAPFAFNRKEAKQHGEGGQLVGAELQGNIVIVDDVITAGTAIRESMAIIQDQGAKPAGVLVALDRQERGKGELSAIQEVEQTFGIPVISIVNLQQVLDFIKSDENLKQYAEAVAQYRQQYGVA